MAVKLYLHIGYPKCGSSTIQEALHINRETLKGLGYGVCDGDLDLMDRKSKHRFPVGYFLSIAQTVRGGGTVDLEPEFRKLHDRAKRAGLKAVIVSAENLGAPWAAEVLKSARQFFDCEIVAYVRRQDEWLLSGWAQWQFKRGESLEAFLDRSLRVRHAGVYRKTLENYIACFGREALTVRLLSRRHLKGGDLVQDFWQAIGLGGVSFTAVSSMNISFSPSLAATLKESAYLFEHPHDNRLTSYIDSHHRYRGGVKKPALTAEDRRRIMARFEDENRWLEETFFAGVDLGDWRAVADGSGEAAARDLLERDAPTLRGLAELVSLNTAVLRSLKQDVDRIKASLGID